MSNPPNAGVPAHDDGDAEFTQHLKAFVHAMTDRGLVVDDSVQSVLSVWFPMVYGRKVTVKWARPLTGGCTRCFYAFPQWIAGSERHVLARSSQTDEAVERLIALIRGTL